MTHQVNRGAVLFDLVGTLVTSGYKFVRDGHPAMPSVSRDEVAAWWERTAGGARERDLVGFLANHDVVDPGHVAFDVAEREASGMRADPEAASTLGSLREMGWRLALVSNTCAPSAPFVDALARLDLARQFDVMLFSSAVGYRKPHPRMFELALAELGVPAARAIHVGDLPSRDVAGAKSAGIRAVLLDRARQWHAGNAPAAPDFVVHELCELPPLLRALVE